MSFESFSFIKHKQILLPNPTSLETLFVINVTFCWSLSFTCCYCLWIVVVRACLLSSFLCL